MPQLLMNKSPKKSFSNCLQYLLTTILTLFGLYLAAIFLGKLEYGIQSPPPLVPKPQTILRLGLVCDQPTYL